MACPDDPARYPGSPCSARIDGLSPSAPTMTLRLHNNLTRQLETFTPLDPACPTLYVCGPTVYNYVHIGNARGPFARNVVAQDHDVACAHAHHAGKVCQRERARAEDAAQLAAEGLPIQAGGGFDFVLADLGVSSMQHDRGERGATEHLDGRLELVHWSTGNETQLSHATERSPEPQTESQVS